MIVTELTNERLNQLGSSVIGKDLYLKMPSRIHSGARDFSQWWDPCTKIEQAIMVADALLEPVMECGEMSFGRDNHKRHVCSIQWVCFTGLAVAPTRELAIMRAVASILEQKRGVS